MSLLPGAVLLVGWSRVEIVQRVVIRSNAVQSLLGPVSISPTRVGVHHGRWNAAEARGWWGSRRLVRNRVGRIGGQLDVARISPASA